MMAAMLGIHRNSSRKVGGADSPVYYVLAILFKGICVRQEFGV